MLRPRDADDIYKRVAFGMPAAGGSCLQIDGHARIGQCVHDDTVTVTATKHVRAGAAFQLFPARPTQEPIVTLAALQGVVALAEEEVVASVAPKYVCISFPAPEPVIAAAALQSVVAGAFAYKQASKQHVVVVVANEAVGMLRPDDPFDPRERVTLGGPPFGRAGRQVDRDARVGLPVESDIRAIATVEHVRAACTP